MPTADAKQFSHEFTIWIIFGIRIRKDDIPIPYMTGPSTESRYHPVLVEHIVVTGGQSRNRQQI